MYVADYGNHCLQKLTSNEEFLHQFSQKGSDQGQFDGSSAVIVDSNNRLILQTPTTIGYNEDGAWLLTIDGKDPNHTFYSPHDLALDPQGNIHAAAYCSNQIKVFTKEGVYVRMYSAKGSISGIAIDDEGYSIVCYDGGHSIYDPQEKTIKAITVEKLFCSGGIAALDSRDGRVYVAGSCILTVLKCSSDVW